MIDPHLPELRTGDPRLCAGREDYAEMLQTYGKLGEPVPEWVGPVPYSTVHQWQGNSPDRMYCRWCVCTSDHVRQRFSEWRYEEVIERHTAALQSLAAAIREGRA